MYFSGSDSHFCCSSARPFLLKVQNVLMDVMDSTGSVSLENAGADPVGAGRHVISVFLRAVARMGPVRNQASASVSAAGREHAAIEAFGRVHRSAARETPPVCRWTEREDMRVCVLLETAPSVSTEGPAPPAVACVLLGSPGRSVRSSWTSASPSRA